MALLLNDLRESNEFLNALIDNIHSAVFILDESFRIHHFNSALEALFGKSGEMLMAEPCGNAIGCAFAVREKHRCGETSNCGKCDLRHSVLKAFTQKATTYRQKLVREFFIENKPILKHFEYTTKYILFENQEMILLIVDDVTESEIQKLELEKKQKRLDEDLKAAAGIQQSLLPQTMPEVEALEIDWRFMPCEFIGGDIFNVFSLDDSHIGCYMLDVSGHGVPSALVTVSVWQALRPSPPFYEVTPPSEVCRALDEEYPFERFNNFFSIVYMAINFREGYCIYTNAGHPLPVLIHRNGDIELLNQGGPIIGLGGEMPYEEERKDIRSGDKIILYTDGLLEHQNPKGEFYGQERLYAKLKELRELPIGEILTGLVDSVKKFGNQTRLRDDVSLLGIEFKGHTQQEIP